MHSSRSDVIVSAWQEEGEVLSYSQIKDYLVRRGIISETNDRSPSRWLKRLVESGVLKKTDSGYALEAKPKAYQTFDYLHEIRQKYGRHIYEGEIGTWISHVCAMTYLNFEEDFFQELYEKAALETISIRLGELFWALFELRNYGIRKQSGWKRIELPDTVIREVFFAMLTESIGAHRSTDEIRRRFLTMLGSRQRSQFQKLWKKHKLNRKERSYHFLLSDFFLADTLPENISSFKRKLKKTSKIDIDNYTTDELVQKLIDINEWIERNHEQEMQTKHDGELTGYAFTQEESELEASYRMAIMAKIAEKVKELGTDMEDFAIVLTRHPATMNQYCTPEHILYEAMEWARKPPDDEALSRLWHEVYEREKTFEGMVADHLVTMGGRDIQVYEALKSKPWVRMELAKHGSLDKILEIYSKKRKRNHRQRHKKSLFKTLGLLE